MAEQNNLTRQELLSAIDFEISQKGSAMARHGITTWGLAAATLGLIWASGREAAAGDHSFSSVLLVLVAANWLIGYLCQPWMAALGWGVSAGPLPKQYTFKHAMLNHGIDPDALLHQVVPTFLMLAICLYLGVSGFPLVGIVGCAGYILALAAVAFCYALSRIRIPIRIKNTYLHPQSNLRTRVLSKLLSVVITSVPLSALALAWPLAALDVRLGVLLGAALFVFSISTQLVRPPATAGSLLSIRSRLAFGEITPEAAKNEVDWILYCSPEERYLTEKADQVISALETCRARCDAATDAIKEITALANTVIETARSESALKQVAEDFGVLHRRMLENMKSVPTHMNAAIKLRAELTARVEAAKFVLDVTPTALKAIIERVDVIGREANSARIKLAASTENFKPALNLLYDAQKDLKMPRKLTFSDAYKALFRN